MEAPDCVFCKIIDGKIPAHIVYRDKQAVGFLLRRLAFSWPPQDVQIDRRRLPALPRSRVVLSDVRLLR